jgi:hypothetical protein
VPVAKPPEQAFSGDHPLNACNRAIRSVKAKADRNERLARLTSSLIILASALIPIAIILSTKHAAFTWGKLTPSILAAVSAVAAGVLQVERPHERWKLYRGYQRVLEAERLRYENRVGVYDAAEQPRNAAFAERIAEVELRLHDDWGGLIPVSAAVAARGPSYPPAGTSPPAKEPAK